MSQTDLTSYFEQLRAAAEQEITHLKLAQTVCEEMEYEIEDIPNIVRLFRDAVDEASHLNARIGGDSYKPYDPDLAHPTKDVLKPILEQEFRKLGIKKPDQKSFKFK